MKDMRAIISRLIGRGNVRESLSEPILSIYRGSLLSFLVRLGRVLSIRLSHA